MLGSGLYFGIGGQDDAKGQAQAAILPVRQVSVQAVSASNIPVEVSGIAPLVAVQPLNPSLLTYSEFESILLRNYTDVYNVEYEQSQTYGIFMFSTQKPLEVAAQLSQGLKISGGANVYPVYHGPTPYGEADIIGASGLEVGDTVEVILLARKDGAFQTLIGFVSEKPKTENKITSNETSNFSDGTA